ncbi:MAG TPA: formyltetrahydrofolate deformylase [Candidatus Limnocylindrales bacterium]|nr:formyltetrahydrofolate deformylase [Candidatus Limnocylindrales bacterium]
MPASNPAVVSVLGRDQKGVVARICTYLAQHSVNIEQIEQNVMEGLFIMSMLVDLKDLDVNLDTLILDLKGIGSEMQMEVTIRLHGERTQKRVALLVSKEAHCLEALIDAHANQELDAEFPVVLSNHPDLEPLAVAAGIPFRWAPSTDKPAHMEFLAKELASVRPDFVVLARYMQVLTPELTRAYASRIINIHPSLLPYYPGANAYKQAYEAGIRVCGCTAHIVTEELDKGPILLQDVFHIRVGEDSLETVKANGRALEAKVLTKAVQLCVRDEIVVMDGKVLFRPGRVN